MTILENAKHALHFFTKFLHRPRHVGSVLPSSGYLARAMLKGLALDSNPAVLELGPGTGPFTRQLSIALKNPSAYLGIDREASFIELLQKKIPNFQFVHGQAEEMHKIWPSYRPNPPNVVLSSLPFANFDEALQNEILNSLIAIASPGTLFRTFQYAFTFRSRKSSRFRARMAEVYGLEVSRELVWLNLPPAYVLTWVKA